MKTVAVIAGTDLTPEQNDYIRTQVGDFRVHVVPYDMDKLGSSRQTAETARAILDAGAVAVVVPDHPAVAMGVGYALGLMYWDGLLLYVGKQ